MGSSFLITIKTTLGKYNKYLKIIMMKLMIICLTFAAISEVNGIGWYAWNTCKQVMTMEQAKRFIGMTIEQAKRFIQTHNIEIWEIVDGQVATKDDNMHRLNVELRNGKIVRLTSCS